MGTSERAVRTAALAGALAVAMSARRGSWLQSALFALAAIDAFTVLTRYCPLNQALGINTCHREEQRRGPATTRAVEAPQWGEYMGERRPEHYAG